MELLPSGKCEGIRSYQGYPIISPARGDALPFTSASPRLTPAPRPKAGIHRRPIMSHAPPPPSKAETIMKPVRDLLPAPYNPRRELGPRDSRYRKLRRSV